jgi:hypothetical protein
LPLRSSRLPRRLNPTCRALAFQSARTKEAMPRYTRRYTRRRPSDWIVNIGWIRKMRWLTPFQIVFVLDDGRKVFASREQSLVFRRCRGFRSQELRNHHVLIPRKTRNGIKVAFCQLFSLSRTIRRYARHGGRVFSQARGRSGAPSMRSRGLSANRQVIRLPEFQCSVYRQFSRFTFCPQHRMSDTA